MMGKHIAINLRNDKIDALSNLCIIKLIVNNVLIINKTDIPRGQIISFWIQCSKNHYFRKE